MAATSTDLNLGPKEISGLTSADAIAGFFAKLGYNTSRRAVLTPEAIGLAGDSAASIKQIEVLSEDAEGFLRVVFVQVRSLTAKSRLDLARVLGRTNVDHLLILTSDFSTLEFVLLDKRRREVRGPVKGIAPQVVPLPVTLDRKSPSSKELRTLRRLTWTTRDGLEQFDKLRSVFVAAAFTEDYFCNRALFADHFLMTRLREDPAWQDNPTQPFHAVKELISDAARRWKGKGEQLARQEFYGPLFELLGFQATINKQAGDGRTKPDFVLTSKSGDGKSAAFVYTWDRWLDGPDFDLDQETPDENPGACVVTALEEGVADWIIVTNGRQWRLYSKAAHSRATNFYEVDLVEALLASGDTDPNEAFRYWWLFFRAQAFEPRADGAPPSNPVGCWLDSIAEGSREYAKELGERLKTRVFENIFRHLALGFLEDRKKRLDTRTQPDEDGLRDTFEATLTLLYRLLFLLYAEARDLLPIREAPYREASLRKIKDEIAEKGGIAESELAERLAKAYSVSEHTLYDRLMRLCAAMDNGDPSLNVPIYNGGLFITSPRPSGEGQGKGAGQLEENGREQRIARYLAEHKVPDRYLALAIDRLARDPDDKTYSLVAIDYKSLEVRHLGSIYEGLLEFKLKIADDDLTSHTEKKKEKYIPLGQAKPKRGKLPIALVRKGEVYLSNDKSERKASGSYYTPDPIVEYIVEHTVGPVLDEKLEQLRPEFRKVRKTFDNELAKLRVPPVPGEVSSGKVTERDWAAEKTYFAHKDLVDRLFDFRVLDPAMGSGHFLVEAVDRITDRLLAFLNAFPINPVTFMLERTRRNILAALAEQGVQVDPDKLTEVNLLKRHVLKRCIYGVDLNPMAVELAKVSLWLDAFTIGAPLSFLDHHLRCGNSLIGGTFKDLETATKGQLFGIDYQPMLEAIRYVLDVNRKSDATASEVKASASQYGQARDKLAGYQIVLDLLVAKHFSVPDAPELLARGGSEFDLASRSRFMQSLADLNELAVVEKVEKIAAQPHLRFFHWDIEFPEVFFGFADTEQRLLKPKNEIMKGSAGFDSVIGNPPYVRMELIKPLKPFLKTHYECHSERADLLIYFYERALNVLGAGGRFAYIASSNWTKTTAGAELRAKLASTTILTTFLDLSDAGVFEDVSTYPCVVVVRKHSPSPGHLVQASKLWTLNSFIGQGAIPSTVSGVEQDLLRHGPWKFDDPRELQLRQKIEATGQRLVNTYGPPLYGIKTGLNQAFVVDEATAQSLLEVDPASSEVLKPYLEGKDVSSWLTVSHSRWLLYLKRGTDISKYPAIEEHLSKFRATLNMRATHQEWYELQQSQAKYASCFERPKILFPRFVNRPCFSLDASGAFVNNAISVLPTDDLALLFFLMSPIAWFFLRSAGAPMANGYRQLHGHVVESLPVPHLSSELRQKIEDWVRTAMKVENFGNPPWNLLYEHYALTDGDIDTVKEQFHD